MTNLVVVVDPKDEVGFPTPVVPVYEVEDADLASFIKKHRGAATLILDRSATTANGDPVSINAFKRLLLRGHYWIVRDGQLKADLRRVALVQASRDEYNERQVANG